MTTISNKSNLIAALAIGAVIGHQGWWLAAPPPQGVDFGAWSAEMSLVEV